MKGEKAMEEVLAELARASYAWGAAQAQGLPESDPQAYQEIERRYQLALTALDEAIGRPHTLPAETVAALKRQRG